jgi:hypothetical protein
MASILCTRPQGNAGFNIDEGRQLTNLLSLVHGQTSSSQTCYGTKSAILDCIVITLLRCWYWCWCWSLCISALLVPSLLLTIALLLVIAPAAIALLLIVASTAIALLLWIATTVVALWLVSGVRVVEGTLAGLRVNENVALVSLVPFRIPWRW